MKYFILLPLFLFCAILSFSQKVFFVSTQQISKSQLTPFYSSINVLDDLLVFQANDYNLYLYNLRDTSLVWQYSLNYKSDVPPLISAQGILAASNTGVAFIDGASGKVMKTLPVSLETTPKIKDGIIYGTGLLDGGCIFSYVPGEDTIRWKRFIAHGTLFRPYYFNDGMYVNMEGDKWVRMEYTGRFTSASCDTFAYSYPEELPCLQMETVGFTHDGRSISRKLAEKLFSDNIEYPEIMAEGKKTFLYAEGRLIVLGDKLKQKAGIEIASLSGSIPNYDDGYSRLVRADEKNAYVMQGNWFIIVDHHSKKLVKAIDLSAWQPHQVVVDPRGLWVVSGKDGLLYGISL